MYSNNNCKILQSKFENQYINSFYEFYIKTAYGDNLVLGESLINEDKDE